MRFRFSNQNNDSPSFYSLLFNILLVVIGIDSLLDARQQKGEFLLIALGLFCLIVGGSEIYRNAVGLIKNKKCKGDFDRGCDLDYNPQTGTYERRDRSLYCPYCGTAVKGDFEFCKHCGKRLP